MSDKKNIEVRNKEGWFGTKKNADGSPVKEIREDDKKVGEIRNKEGWFGTQKNADGTPVKEVKRS